MNVDEPNSGRIVQRKISAWGTSVQCIAQNDFWKTLFYIFLEIFLTYRLRHRKIRNSNHLQECSLNKIHLPKQNLPVQKDYWYNNFQQLELSVQVFDPKNWIMTLKKSYMWTKFVPSERNIPYSLESRHYSLPPWNCHSRKLNSHVS